MKRDITSVKTQVCPTIASQSFIPIGVNRGKLLDPVQNDKKLSSIFDKSSQKRLNRCIFIVFNYTQNIFCS